MCATYIILYGPTYAQARTPPNKQKRKKPKKIVHSQFIDIHLHVIINEMHTHTHAIDVVFAF